MFGVIGFVLIFVLVFGLLIVSIVFNTLRKIFGFGFKPKNSSSNNKGFSPSYEKKTKIIDKSVGEYVDFEEIKVDKPK